MASETEEQSSVDEQLVAHIENRANGVCEGDSCENSDDLTICNIGNGEGFSLSDLKYLCPDCRDKYSNKKLTTNQVIQQFESTDLPFTSAPQIAENFNVSQRTARRRLEELVHAGDLAQYQLDANHTLYFKTDFKAGEEFLDGLRSAIDLTELDTDKIKDFARKPYTVLPKGENEKEYYVVTPRFLPFSLGHLFKQDDAFQTFVVNKHVSWFEGIPDEIQEKITLRQKYDKAIINDDYLEFTSPDERDRAWRDFDGEDGPLKEKEGDTKIKVQQGKEFEVIAQLIDGGNLPFVEEPIEPEEIRPSSPDISLRDYQKNAWETFEKYGQVGIFWPPGSGKTFAGLYFGDRIKGEKLVVVPTRLLQSQWESRIKQNTRNPDEWDVKTYQYLTHGDNINEYDGENAPDLTVFDEAHIIPADTFSKLALIDTEYRIGLSATPYREDGRENYIFSLTGMPVGVDWQQLVEHGVVEYPAAWVYLYTTEYQRKQDLKELAQNKPGEGIIFCDSLDQGEQLADDLGIPFVSGDTDPDNRIEIIKNNRVSIVSRIGDEGLSIDSIDWTIEYDFLGASRRQELQRVGRLMHDNNSSDDNESIGQHILMLTDKEADKFGDRLWSLEEKGIDVT